MFVREVSSREFEWVETLAELIHAGVFLLDSHVASVVPPFYYACGSAKEIYVHLELQSRPLQVGGGR